MSVAREAKRYRIFFFFLPQCVQLDIWVLFIVKEEWNGCWGEQSGASASQLFPSSNRKVASGAISGLWYNHGKWWLRNLCSTCRLGLKLLPLITVIFGVTIFQVYVLSTFHTFYVIPMALSVRHCPFHVIGEKTKTQIDGIIGPRPQNSQWWVERWVCT